MSKETPESKDSTNVEVTSLAEIKARVKSQREGEPLRLPSGLVFKVRKPSISRLMKDDVFPTELVSAALNMDSGSHQPKTKKEYLDSLKVIDIVVQNACVMPKAVATEDELDDESILLSDIDDQDKIAIYLFAQTGVKSADKSFRSDEANSNS